MQRRSRDRTGTQLFAGALNHLGSVSNRLHFDEGLRGMHGIEDGQRRNRELPQALLEGDAVTQGVARQQAVDNGSDFGDFFGVRCLEPDVGELIFRRRGPLDSVGGHTSSPARILRRSSPIRGASMPSWHQISSSR